jgi:diadenosine tetraphosphatase ApaH/serine/threonine PP2A family protein phosphatase
VVLGDVVGYNAMPEATVQWLRDKDPWVVAGNHDRELDRARPRLGTRAAARAAQAWTREQLSDESLTYLRGLPNRHVESSEFVAVHGCYLNDEHTYGYVTSTMLGDNLEALRRRADWPRLAFCGHTHMPLLGWCRGDDRFEHVPEARTWWPKDADAVLLNPGAVGQPRDGDPRASFAVVDTDDCWVQIERVKYSTRAAAEAILSSGLPPELGARLEEGR